MKSRMPLNLAGGKNVGRSHGIRPDMTSPVRMEGPVSCSEFIAGIVFGKELVFAETIAESFSVVFCVLLLCSENLH